MLKRISASAGMVIFPSSTGKMKVTFYKLEAE